MIKISRYRKFIAAAAAGAAVLAVALSDGRVQAEEWWLVVSAVLGPLGVYAMRNEPPADPGVPPSAMRSSIGPQPTGGHDDWSTGAESGRPRRGAW